VYWLGSAPVHMCTILDPPQFTRVLAGDGTGTSVLTGWRITASTVTGSLLRLKDKHSISCADGDKCGMFYILLAIDVVTSDLFGVPHTDSRVVECYR